MKLAEYSTDEKTGHFGLGLEKYTHFTSPIRRYSDLVIHRLLLDQNVNKAALNDICTHLSTMERNSFRAEQTLNKIKKMRLLQLQYCKDRDTTYTAIISKIKPFAIFFDLEDFYMEGSIHISELGNEYFIFHSNSNSLEGKKSGKELSVGKKIEVRIISFSMILQTVEFALV